MPGPTCPLESKGSKTELFPPERSWSPYVWICTHWQSCSDYTATVRVIRWMGVTGEEADSLCRWVEVGFTGQMILTWPELSPVRRRWKRGNEMEASGGQGELCVGNQETQSLVCFGQFLIIWPRHWSRIFLMSKMMRGLSGDTQVPSALHFWLCWINGQYFYRKLSVLFFFFWKLNVCIIFCSVVKTLERTKLNFRVVNLFIFLIFK